MHISKIITKGLGTLIEFEAKLQMIEDKEFYHLHEQIIKKSTSKMSPLPGLGQASCIRVNLRLLTSASEILSKANPDVRRIGFPNVILPGDIRNDLYITLERGNFDKSGKTGSRNIEITCLVIDQEGQIVENCIYYASGQCGKSRASLPILYHNNSPIWNENVRLQMPIDKFYNAHLRLEFRHCSAKDKNDKKLLGNYDILFSSKFAKFHILQKINSRISRQIIMVLHQYTDDCFNLTTFFFFSNFRLRFHAFDGHGRNSCQGWYSLPMFVQM